MHLTKMKYLFPTIVAALILTIIAFGIASAHELTPISSSPAEGEVVQQPPSMVRLTFEEEISEDGSTLQVFDTQGNQVDLGNGGVDLDDPQHAALVVDLPDLAEGVYLVKWQITLTDGDASLGEYRFGVGNVTLSEAPAPAQDPAPDPGSPLLVWGAMLVGLLLVAGVVIYFLRKSRSSL
jgi:methionine-rich copper-binding protein CopC